MRYLSSENTIIQQCRRGEPRAQQALYELYIPYALGIMKRFGIKRQDMKDITQNIFVEIFMNIDKYDSEKGKFKSWFQSVSTFTILKWLRKNNKGMIYLENTALEFEQENYQSDSDHQWLIHLLQRIPEKYRIVFNLHVIDGFSHKEIAQRLQIKEASSRSILSRARAMLKNLINQESINYERFR